MNQTCVENEKEQQSYLQSLIRTDPLRESTVRSIIEALQLPIGSKGLDVGCGIGTQALMLAEFVGPSGHVTGVDVSREFLTYAKNVAKKIGKGEHVSFKEGDMIELPFNDNTFDWAWSMDCVGYHLDDPITPLKEMARVVKPGGTVTILVWSSEMLLPGYPILESKLDSTSSGIAPFIKGKDPKKHFLRGLGMLHEVGLNDVSARTFIGNVHAPLTKEIKDALTEIIQTRWEGAESELSGDDLKQFQRLCNPQSDEFILNLPDYYAFFTYSQFIGRVPL